MKKSTLITTIAMIVVVVVALSTATYAWFSSQTTSSVSGTITTTAKSDWIIMGASRVTAQDGSKDTATFSSSQAISLVLLSGLYSPTAELTQKPTANAATTDFALTPFFDATQDGTGMVTKAKAATQASIDPIDESNGGLNTSTPNVSSAGNYVRIVNTKATSQTLKLTITVITNGDTDSDFVAANGFSTYVAWRYTPEKTGNETPAEIASSANTAYYYGTLAENTTGTGTGAYYEATRVEEIAASGVTYAQATVDAHNAQGLAIPSTGYVDASTTNVTIGEETIQTGKYYQMTITIADASHKIATNGSVTIAFYAWFDGWVIDNTGSNSNATVYYEFGAIS